MGYVIFCADCNDGAQDLIHRIKALETELAEAKAKALDAEMRYMREWNFADTEKRLGDSLRVRLSRCEEALRELSQAAVEFSAAVIEDPGVNHILQHGRLLNAIQKADALREQDEDGTGL